jgi:hypothetical protein
MKTATEAYDKGEDSVASVTNQVFLLYPNLLLEEARQPCNKILAEQIDCSPWAKLQGVKHTAPQNKTWDSFMECFVLLFQIYSKYSSFMKPFFESGNSQI